MKISLKLFFFIFCILGFNAAKATTYTWNIVGSGNWTTATNWLPNTGYPGKGGTTTDIAVINTNGITVTLTSTITIANLEITTYGIYGVTVSVSSGSTLNVTSGVSTSQPNPAGVSFTFAGAGTTKIGGLISAGYSSSFAISSGATVYFTTNSTFDEYTNYPHGSLTNNGTLNILSGSTIKLSDQSSLINMGTIHSYSSTYTINASGGAGGITNFGTYIDHGSTYTLTGALDFLNDTTSSSTMHLSGSTVNLGTSSSTNNDFINNTGTFTADSATSINVPAYKSHISNAGTFYAGTSGSACTITLNGQSTAIFNTSVFKVGSSSIVYPSGVTAQITNTSPGVFTIQSDANGSGTIGPLNSTAGSLSVCTGIFNVERYLSGGSTYSNGRWVYRGYRLMSSPVSTVSSNTGSTNSYPFTFKYLATSGIVTGAIGGYSYPSTFNSATAYGNPTIYLYREDLTPSNQSFISGNFIGVTNITNATTITTSEGTTPSVSVGNGFFFFFRGDNIHSIGTSPGKTTSPFVAPEPVTFTAIGYLNQQTYQVQNWVVGGGSLKYETNPTYNSVAQNNTGIRGFNLVGNPYASSIDWETYNASNTSTTGIVVNTTGGVANVLPTIWVINPFTNQYNTYMKGDGGIGKGLSGSGSGNTKANIIASGQGFYVKATNHATTLTFNESAKSITQPPSGYLFMGTPVASSVLQYMRLILQKDTLNNDDLLIFFNSSASTKYNPMEDAAYLPGNAPLVSLGSISSDSVKLAINRLPFPDQKSPLTIRLAATATKSGQYTLKRTDLKAIPAIYDIWLMDKYKKDSLDIRNNTDYIFNIDLTDTASFGTNRFAIVIRQNPVLGVHLLNFAAVKAADGSQITWKTENEQNYTNFTVQRSTDGGVTYSVLGGFSSSALGSYSFLDKNPANGADQYRLMMQDLNGTITYSNIVTLIYGNGNTNTIASNLSVYPNPSSGVINLTVLNSGQNSNVQNISSLQQLSTTPSLAVSNSNNNANYQISIMSITGTIIKTENSSSANWQGNITGVTPGTYIIQVVNNTNKSLVGRSTFVKL